MAFIYKITNLINNKCYIGKTERTILSRWKEHLQKRKTLDLPLYRALNKYGIEQFTIECLEECNSDILDERETYWILYYDSCKNGYNCTLGGEGGLLYLPEEELENIINRYNNGERLDVLCKEFHHDYYPIKTILEKRGIKINTNAGPAKVSKKIYAINPITLQIENIYDSISAAGRAICTEGKNPHAISNHISRYKNTSTISHGFLWKTEEHLGDYK